MKILLFIILGTQLMLPLAAQNVVKINGINYQLLYGQNAIVTKGDYKGQITVPGSFTSAGKTYRVTSVGMDAFRNCKDVTKITLSPPLDFISDYAFFGCENLLNINIPASVTNIGNGAFWGCKKLASVHIPASVTLIQGSVFEDCGVTISVDPKNKDYSGLNGVLYSKDKTTLFHCPATFQGVFTVPGSVKYINESAFEGCSLITGVKIPNSIQDIASKAFYNCSKLQGVYVNSANPPTLDTHVFEKIFDEELYLTEGEFEEAQATIYVPKGSKSAYSNKENWKDYKIIEMSSPVVN